MLKAYFQVFTCINSAVFLKSVDSRIKEYYPLFFWGTSNYSNVQDWVEWGKKVIWKTSAQPVCKNVDITKSHFDGTFDHIPGKSSIFSSLEYESDRSDYI